MHNPETSDLGPHPWSLANVVYQLHNAGSLAELLPTELLSWLEMNIDAAGPQDKSYLAWSEENPIKSFVKSGADAKTIEKAAEFWRPGRLFASALGLLPGQNAVVINGRVSVCFALYLRGVLSS
jgi:hypothetical protein